jgi:hypothetical protein
MATKEKKDLVFKMRLDEQDRNRLDEIARQYSAPAATAVRMLIKKEFDRLQEQQISTLTREHRAVLKILFDWGQTDTGLIKAELEKEGYNDPPWFSEVLKQLRNSGYIQKLGNGYSPTEKGEAAARKHR